MDAGAQNVAVGDNRVAVKVSGSDAFGPVQEVLLRTVVPSPFGLQLREVENLLCNLSCSFEKQYGPTVIHQE